MDKKLKFIDLFAGIGGVRIGFEKAGFQCVFSSEINKACQSVYNNNFNEIPYSDVTQINANILPDYDILTAGFPCQPFSICGKQKGFEDTRGTLFFHICNIIRKTKPKVIFLENVKHLIHHDKGNTLKVVLSSLENLGYDVSYKILNANSFGVPQNRERIIIIGTIKNKFNFDNVRTIENKVALRDFLSSDENFEYLTKEEYTIIDNYKTQKSGLIFIGYRNKKIRIKGVRPNTNHLSRVHKQPNRIYSIDGVHPTLASQETSGRYFIYIPEEEKVRKLTIKECYKIMGFPNDFKLYDKLTECYRQIGNSVCIPMVTSIANEIKHHF